MPIWYLTGWSSVPSDHAVIDAPTEQAAVERLREELTRRKMATVWQGDPTVQELPTPLLLIVSDLA